VALKDKDGNDPSGGSPVKIQIGDTVREITSALSVTIPDGTNYFNAGSSEVATYDVPFFVYVVWDSNSSAVALSVARRAHYRVVASSMSTTTDDKHLFNYANFTDGDAMANIGYFEAQNTGSAAYDWSVSAFTNDNLRHEPTFESRSLQWNPTWSGNGSMTVTLTTLQYATYKIVSDKCMPEIYGVFTIGGTLNTLVQATSPINTVDSNSYVMFGNARNSGSGPLIVSTGGIYSDNLLYVTTQNGANWTSGTGRRMLIGGGAVYPI
ncbi:MAG: hypothetical protein R3307_10665, partial [Anaerolineales bacterium]|nr:hypothetical protein [Anaerolineales bacterium]